MKTHPPATEASDAEWAPDYAAAIEAVADQLPTITTQFGLDNASAQLRVLAKNLRANTSPAAAVGGDRAARMLAYVTGMATRHGWIEADGEGALEFLFRKHYATGRDDALASQPPAGGFVVVPRRLTLDMNEAGIQELEIGNDFVDAWEAAIATHLNEPTSQGSVLVSDDDVACAYQAADGYIDSNGGDVSKLDDGQWDEMLRLVLERYSQGARA